MILIYLTCENREEAQSIAKTLLEEELIACANIFPSIHSMYLWESKIELADESVMILKTLESNYEKLKTRIIEIHSYDCPCIVALPVEAVNDSCANWLSTSLK